MNSAAIDALQICPQFSGFTNEELMLFAHRCEIISYMEQETVFSFYREKDSIFVVVSGRLQLRLKNGAAREFTTGDFFGELGALSSRGRLGAIQCMEDSELLIFSKSAILDDETIPLSLRYRLLQNICQKIISYFYDEIPVSSKELIKHGENESVEFKASFADPAIESIAAFANAKGGTIFIGVQDDGKVIGIETDTFGFNEYKLNMLNSIKRKAGQITATLVNIDFEDVDKCMIARIDVFPSKTPIIMSIKRKDNTLQEALMVRTGAMNTKIISMREIIDYFQIRFK